MADTGLPVDEDGAPLYPIVAWYDQRCAPQMAWFSKQITSARFHAITGQRFSTSLGVSKWLWFKDNLPKVKQNTASWLSVSDYLLYRLTGEMATDYSMASRMGLFDQNSLTWSGELCDLADLCVDRLPKVYPSGTIIGELNRQAADQTGLPYRMPCVLGGHDHLCAAAAAGAENTHTLVDSCGTAQSVLVTVDHYNPGPLLLKSGYVTYAHVLPGRYVLRGGLRSAGGAIQWLANCLSKKNVNDQELPYLDLMTEAALGMGQRAGPLWLPHLLSSGTPQDDPRSLAAVVGLKAEHDRGDIFRGLLESLAFWLRQNLERIEALVEHPIQEVLLLGGTTRLGLLSQLKADILNRPVVVPQIREPSAMGAAMLAGLGMGCYSNLTEALSSLQYERKVILPDSQRAIWYEKLYCRGYQPIYSALRQINHNLAALSEGNIDVSGL
jgi:xylulokinase